MSFAGKAWLLPIIAGRGLRKGDRLHVHFYKCDPIGHLGGQTVRSGSEVAIVASARQCVEGGGVSYSAPNGVILAEGVRGSVGPQYFRYILSVRRNPDKSRRILWV